MGGRGANYGTIISKKNLDKYTSAYEKLSEQNIAMYKEYSGFARSDLKEVEDARKKWLKNRKKMNILREKINSVLPKPTTNNSINTNKTFVNNFG